jgi:F0F1-type ATP synthase delta subunit
MSAEKEIVNYWYNRKGLFTINNIKTSSSRDCGILALKFEKDKIDEVFHIEVSCSITGNISDASNLERSISIIVKGKFEDASIRKTINSNIGRFSIQKNDVKKILVIGALPKSSKAEIIGKFSEIGVQAIEFQNILYEVLENLDTQYYRNDIIRTLQLVKFLLLSEPENLAKLLADGSLSSSSRKEFLSSILDKGEIIKEFKKTNSERLAAILKSSGMKPSELAHMLDHQILNKKTRKVFFDSLTEQEKIRKAARKIIKKNKNELELNKFF